MVAATTIKISSETKNRLEKIKQYPRETMDDVICRLLMEYEHV